MCINARGLRYDDALFFLEKQAIFIIFIEKYKN